MQELIEGGQRQFLAEETFVGLSTANDELFDSLHDKSIIDIVFLGNVLKSEWADLLEPEFLKGIPEKSPFRIRLLSLEDRSSICMRNDTENFARAMSFLTGERYEPDRAVWLSPAETHQLLSDMLMRAELNQLQDKDGKLFSGEDIRQMFHTLGLPLPLKS